MEEEEDEEGEEMGIEELAVHADDKIDALVNLLVRKGVITEEEFDKEYEAVVEEE